jgi:hypothetical protein
MLKIKDYNIAEIIKKQNRFRRLLTIFCIFILLFGILSFLFYGLDKTDNIVKFTGRKNQLKDTEKTMFNPKIKFEHNNGSIFDIEAKKAVQKGKNDVELFDVQASGKEGKISAGNLLITNNGNNLHFSNNPVLTIIEKNE